MKKDRGWFVKKDGVHDEWVCIFLLSLLTCVYVYVYVCVCECECMLVSSVQCYGYVCGYFLLF